MHEIERQLLREGMGAFRGFGGGAIHGHADFPREIVGGATGKSDDVGGRGVVQEVIVQPGEGGIGEEGEGKFARRRARAGLPFQHLKAPSQPGTGKPQARMRAMGRPDALERIAGTGDFRFQISDFRMEAQPSRQGCAKSSRRLFSGVCGNRRALAPQLRVYYAEADEAGSWAVAGWPPEAGGAGAGGGMGTMFLSRSLFLAGDSVSSGA